MSEADAIIVAYLNKQERLRRSMPPEEWDRHYAAEHLRVVSALCQKFGLTGAAVPRFNSEDPWLR